MKQRGFDRSSTKVLRIRKPKSRRSGVDDKEINKEDLSSLGLKVFQFANVTHNGPILLKMANNRVGKPVKGRNKMEAEVEQRETEMVQKNIPINPQKEFTTLFSFRNISAEDCLVQNNRSRMERLIQWCLFLC
jgi:hypothetical protein